MGALEKIAYQFDVYLTTEEVLQLQKRFGNDFSLNEFSKAMGIHSALVQSI